MSLPFHRRRSFLLGLAALLALLVGPAGMVAAFQSSGNHASPATGHAEVIAHGVSAMPDARVGWKVSEKSAKAIDDEPLGQYPLGFAYAPADPIVVNDYDTGAQTELAGGEAVFIAADATQQHASLGPDSATYTQIALVGESDAPNPDNVFDAPSGGRAINLVRDVLTSGEKTTVPDSGAPALVLVDSGSVKVASGSGSNTLKAGGTAVLTGDITITQTGSNDGVVLIATIGDEIPAAPRFSGTITLQIFGCPAGTSTDSLPAAGATGDNPCKSITSGVNVTLKTANGKSLSLNDAAPVEGKDGAYRWSLLPFGAYEVQKPKAMAEGYDEAAFVGADGSALKSAKATLSRDNPDVVFALYFVTNASGKITATIIDCPAGVTADNANSTTCTDPTLDPVDVTISSDALAKGDLTVKDTIPDNPKHVWDQLPLTTNGKDGATYAITETTLPAGYNSYVIDGAKGGNGKPWTVHLTSSAPEATITIYNVKSDTTFGTVTVDVVVCPSADSTADQCIRPDNGPTGLIGINIAGQTVLTENNASQGNGSPFSWSNLPLTDYTMTVGDLVPPDGYQIVKVETSDGGNPADGFTLSESNPTVNIIVFLTQSGDSGTPIAQS